MPTLTDVTDEVDKIELLIADDEEETATVVLTNERGTITVVGKVTIVEKGT